MSTSFNVTNLPKLRYGSTVDVQSAQVVDGTVLVDTSTWRMYVDLDGHRLDLNTPVPVTTAANLPAQSDRVPGKLYVALDTWTIYLSDGTTWHALEPWRYAVLPAGGTDGQLLAATSDSGVYAWVDPAFGGEAEVVTLWSGDVPGQVSWASDMKSVTVSHSLSGSPSVAVLDSTGTRVYPTVTALPSAVLLSFGTAMSISPSSPWTVALFGADGAIASSDAPADIDDAVRAVLPAITEIPAATSAYSLLDASSDANGHSAVYRHSPSAAPTYTLPDVEDDTVLHEITLSVLFSASVQTCTFQDSSGNTVTPLSTPHIGAGTVVSYLCRYESLLGKWCVMPVVMGTVEA